MIKLSGIIMPNEAIINNSDAMIQFKVELGTSLRKISVINEEVIRGLNQLGKSWQDEGYDTFKQEFLKVNQEVTLFEEGTKKIMLDLQTKIDALKDIERQMKTIKR